MSKSKTIAVLLLFILSFSFKTGWTENNSTQVLRLAAAPQLKRTATKHSVKPVKQLVVKKPDLAVTNMKWSYTLKQGYIVGQNSILNFTLKNQGSAPSGNFIIKFTCPNCPPSMTGIRKITSIMPGKTMGYNWPSPPSSTEKWVSGFYTIEAIADPNRVVKDSNRTNNRKILKFKVQGISLSKKKVRITKKVFAPANLTQVKTGKRISRGFNFSSIPEDGTTGIRTVSGFNFSTQPEPGTTGSRTVTGFNFSTQPMPGTTGKRTVQGFNFVKQ